MWFEKERKKKTVQQPTQPKPVTSPTSFFFRDQPGLKAESESQPGKLPVVCSASPGLHKVPATRAKRVKHPALHCALTPPCSHAPLTLPSAAARRPSPLPACPSSPPHPPVRSHRPWSSLKQIDAVEAEQKSYHRQLLQESPTTPLRGMPCLSVRPWRRAPAGMALARPTKYLAATVVCFLSPCCPTYLTNIDPPYPHGHTGRLILLLPSLVQPASTASTNLSRHARMQRHPSPILLL